MHDEPPRSAALDLAISVVGLWLAAGFMWDSWAHLHVGLESFFTPYHAVFYSAMLAGAVVLGLTARQNRSRGLRLLPAPYRRALWGVPVFFLGGVGDLIWHSFFGVEDRIEAVTSPTHLIIGFGVILLLSGPIGSALAARGTLRTLRDQLPLIFSLATVLEFVHLGTSYAFDVGAARAYGPGAAIGGSADYFTATAFGLYKSGTGILIVLISSAVLAGFALWLACRFRPAFGAYTLLFVLGEGMLAATLTNDSPLLIMHLTMALVAGLAADTMMVRMRPSPLRIDALRMFGAVIPAVYYTTYFGMTIALQGTFWSWSLTVGAIVWSAIVGVGIALLIAPRPRDAGPAVHAHLPATARKVGTRR